MYDYFESVDDKSPSSGNHTAQGGSTTLECDLKLQGTGSQRYTALKRSVLEVLGSIRTDTTDGRIRRTLPLRHPQWDWMWADSVSYTGVGTEADVVTVSAGVGSTVIPKVMVYRNYKVRIGFSTRTHNMWQDKDIKVKEGKLFDKNGDEHNFFYAEEWFRNTRWEQFPANNFITAQQGMMKFRNSGSGGAAAPDDVPFQDSPKMWLPDSIIKVRWVGVPYRYVISKNSYLTKFIGHVNQETFGVPQENGTQEYSPGALVYYGSNPTAIYTNPVPDNSQLAYSTVQQPRRGLLCDLDLSFGYTARTIGSASGNKPNFDSVNKNWIVGGWNLLPWLTTRKYYYVSSFDPSDPNTQSKWAPLFNSIPFSLLFFDPDYVQQEGPFNP